MANHCFICVNTLFKLFIFSLLILAIYDGCERFINDEDVSLIGFKTFHEDADDLYPTITMCFYNPFLQNELIKYGPGINITSYSQYLQGKIWDERMQNIPYDNVTISMENYLQRISGRLENGSYFWLYDHENRHQLNPLARNPPYYTSFKSGVAKCFSFDIPYINDTVIWNVFIQVKTSIFPNGSRSRKISFDGTSATGGGFKVSFHYPQQRFRSSFNMKYQWPEPTEKMERKRKKVGYYMQFRIRGIEVLKHRHKGSKPCNLDWKNDDPRFVQKLLHNVGCTPPQLSFSNRTPVCSTKEKNSESYQQLNYPTTNDFRLYHIPCRVIEKLQYEYTEEHATAKNDENINREWFQVRLYFADTTFKYIEQVGGLSWIMKLCVNNIDTLNHSIQFSISSNHILVSCVILF